MIKTANHYFLGLAVLCFFACEKVDDGAFPEDRLIERKDFVLTRSDLDFIQENNGFAFELFKRVAAIEKGKSTLISPLSVTIDFGVVNNGTAGETRDEINRVLGYREGSVEGLNAFCQSMLVQSAEVDPTTTLNIANAAVVEKIVDDGTVRFGATVRLRRLADGRESEYTIVGKSEADVVNGKISNESPLAAELIGRKTGDVISLPTPRGPQKLEILSIAYGAVGTEEKR